MTDSVKQQCKMPDCVLSKFFHNHNHPNCSYGNNIHTPPVNESWETKLQSIIMVIVDIVSTHPKNYEDFLEYQNAMLRISTLLSTARQEATIQERERKIEEDYGFSDLVSMVKTILKMVYPKDIFTGESGDKGVKFTAKLHEAIDSLTSKGGTNG